MNKYEEYIEGFLETNNVKEKEIFINHIKKMEKIEKFITEWSDKEIDKLIKSTNSISMNAINKYLQYTRSFYQYVCNQEGVIPKKITLTKSYEYYINYEKFGDVLLDKKAYEQLKGEMIYSTFEGDFNFRDKVMIELAWEGLTSEEIKNLKTSEKDIEFINDEKVILHLSKRDVTINNAEIVYDIKQAIQQDKYYIPESLYKKEQWRNLKPSTHLIKPVVTRQSDNECVSNPSQLIRNVFKKMDIGIVPGIDLENVSLEDIKRSSIINAFMSGMDIPEVKEKYGKKTECDIYWLQNIAQTLKGK